MKIIELLSDKVEELLVENEKLRDELIVASQRGSFSIPFVKEVKHALLEVDKKHIALDGAGFDTLTELLEYNDKFFSKKDIVDSSTNFSSRFMPNVKFVITEDQYSHLPEADPRLFMGKSMYGETDVDGEEYILYETKPLGFNRVVSIYEAIPELVPDGMFYDKNHDGLIRLPPKSE